MNARAIHDDNEILRLAERDGCAMALRAALAKMDGSQTAVLTDRRVYLVHAVRGDSGYSCFEVANPLDMPALVIRLAPVLGPISHFSLERHDRDPRQRGRRH